MNVEELGNTVAGLVAKMELMIGILQEIQKDIKSNYMPSAQIEDRFKSQGERIGRIEETLKLMDQDVKDKFIAQAAFLEKQNDQKKELPYKFIFALGALVGVSSAAVGGIIWLIHAVK